MISYQATSTIPSLVRQTTTLARDRWPPERRGRPDPVRAWWRNQPRLAATEIQVAPSAAVILASRVV